MNALIIGGMGYIGSWLARRLLEAGDNVAIVDNCRSHDPKTYDKALFKLKPYVPKLIIDIKDSTEIKVNELKGIDVIYYLAGLVGVPECEADEKASHLQNVEKLAKVLQTATEAGIQRFVYTSTAAVYGDESLCKEDNEVKPLNVYGNHKLMAEQMVLSAPMKTSVARLSNVFGFGFYGNKGVLNKWCSEAVNDKSIVLYGSGDQVRDFVHVRDVVDALLYLSMIEPGVYNVGSGKTKTLKEAANMITKLTNTELLHDSNLRPESEPMKGYKYNINKLRSLGWRPKVTMRKGVKDNISKIREGGLIR